MTGRHAAPPDESFDQRERDRAGAHRADVELPAGVESPAKAPAKKPAPAPKKPAASKATAPATTPTKKAGKR